MLNKIFRIVLTTTSISPMFVGIAIKKYSEIGRFNDPSVYIWIILFALMIFIPLPLIIRAKGNLELIENVSIQSIEPADQEIAGFLVAYVLPLITDIPKDNLILAFTLIFVWIAVIITHSYHFNPILSIVYRYRFYKVDEVINENCVRRSILITKKDLLDCEEVEKMSLVEISENMLLEV
ncbi:hypothetical protein [Thermococcus sp.]|uniref:hypothetical protein n=1 Tax=Thermococcus sp. TaxID=35749 RepID=UPI002602058B|nr:hypothetical protein [Thermococcus sp.]